MEEESGALLYENRKARVQEAYYVDDENMNEIFNELLN